MATDLNAASLRELQRLPGVGPVIAQRIAAARPFAAIQQLQSVQGIGPKRYLTLVSDRLVTLGDAEEAKPVGVKKEGVRADGAPKKEDKHTPVTLVDLNTATIRQLCMLRGVGPALAKRIVEARPFRRKNEITAVRGIGLLTYEKLQDQLLDIAHAAAGLATDEEAEGEWDDEDESPTVSPMRRSRSPLSPEREHPPQWCGDSICLDVVGDIRATALPNASSKVLLASWNIRNLSKKRDAVPLHRIAEILEQFDVVALQEVRDTIVLKRLKNFMPGWDYIASPLVGAESTAPLKKRAEHFVYFYRRRVVAPVGAGRIGFPGNNNDEARSATAVVRPPYVATFQTIGAGTPVVQFTLVNVHVVCGDQDSKQQEIDELRRLVRHLQTETVDGHRNLILLGDFNLPPQDIGRIGSGVLQFEALIRPPRSTTVAGKLYDNLWMNSAGDWHGLRIESGVYRIDWAFYPYSRGVPRQHETPVARLRSQTARVQCTYELSDHCPVWLAIGGSDGAGV